MDEKYNLVVILGPTASGKTRIAARLAREYGSEIISADSRQAYRGLDIGTGKDLFEFVVDGVSVPYNMIDIVDPGYEFNVFEYQKCFYQYFQEISGRGIIPVMVGGTGLYIEAVIKGYRMLEVPENISLRKELQEKGMETLSNRLFALNPELHNTTDLKHRKRLIRAIEIAEYTRNHILSEETRPEINPFIVGVRWNREVLRSRITKRLKERIRMGMIDEVKRLYEEGLSWDKLDFFGLEYRYIGLYLQGKMDYNEMFRVLNTKIHQFAKRQETWFRRMERHGAMIHWIDNADYDSMKRLIQDNVYRNELP